MPKINSALTVRAKQPLATDPPHPDLPLLRARAALVVCCPGAGARTLARAIPGDGVVSCLDYPFGHRPNLRDPYHWLANTQSIEYGVATGAIHVAVGYADNVDELVRSGLFYIVVFVRATDETLARVTVAYRAEQQLGGRDGYTDEEMVALVSATQAKALRLVTDAAQTANVPLAVLLHDDPVQTGPAVAALIGAARLDPKLTGHTVPSPTRSSTTKDT